ncbi:Hypothetical predicted protein [Cloeon dipterum]|uniref:Kazal-like domain-containing protein n=1 Tax=Cloeon dipterum TaxID=197152 RepID=A0A8S1DIG2_9INSE|nr:Hypothetical predicted protein [Cloeon dipterum]
MSPYIFFVLGLLLLVACAGRAKDRYNIRDTSMAECPSVGSCNPSHKPLCARNSHGSARSFSNPCIMKVVNCKDKTDYARIRKGFC